MRLAYVVPRYGAEVVGGAEMAVRMLVERVASSLDWSVEVLTTCARDSRTWANEYASGTSVENGVTVHRFAATGRDPGFDAFSGHVLLGPTPSWSDQQEWMQMQGPVSDELLDAAASSEADLVVFSPYLYDPIVRGVPRVGGRAVVHPAAHDEPALALPILAPVFTDAAGFVFYTHGERRLVERRFAVGHTPSLVLGLGVEPPASPPDPAALGIDEPYLLCVGRVDESKGTGLLAQAFAAYKARRPGPLKLVFAGQVVDRPVEHPDVVVAGPVPEDVKWGGYAGAVGLVQPSPYESFSLVLIEGWLAGAPALVNAACLATREHVSRSGGGLTFGSYAEFEVAVDRLLGDPGLRGRLAEAGRAYAESAFAWPVLLERYARFMSSAVDRTRR